MNETLSDFLSRIGSHVSEANGHELLAFIPDNHRFAAYLLNDYLVFWHSIEGQIGFVPVVVSE